MELQDKYIRFDWAVKRLLRHKANFGVLEGFLTVLIGDEIHIVEILESEGNQQTENDKFNRVDIKALNSKNEIVIIEIQNTRELYYWERILYGVAKAITEHISLGETYYKVKKIYSISILYFDIGHGTDYLYHGQNIFKGVHTGDFLQVSTREKDAIVPRMPSEIYPEYFLIRVNEFNKVAVTPLEEWIEYLKTGIIRPDTTAPGLGEAREKLKYYSMTPQERHAYDEHLSALMIQNDVLDSAKLEGKIEGRLEGRAEGREEGHEEGIKEGVLRNARRMKEKGFSTEDIMDHLAKEFIPPIEREDIVSLSQNIDNVTDKVEDILLRIYMNNVSSIGEDAMAMMDVVVQCCEAVKELLEEFADFRRSKNLKKVVIRINDLEESADKLFMTSMRKLYTQSEDPIHIIAWREIYIYLERCADACEHVADVVESVVMKNA